MGAVIATVATAAIWAGLAAPADASVPAQFHGVSLQRHLTENDETLLDDGNVGVVRFLISWEATEPRPGAYDWTSTDAYLEEIGRTGGKALPFFGALPGWLQTDTSGDPMSTPASRGAWREFVGAFMDRYGPGGPFYAAHPEAARVHTWQIWNEPNLDGPWGGKADPDSYAKMVEIASEIIRDRDPNAEIMLAGLAPAVHSIRPWSFIEGLLTTLDPDTFDTVAVHPYSQNQAGVNSQIYRVRQAMVEGGAGDKPLALTEFGWASSHKANETLAGTERSQAKHVTKAYKTFARHREGWNLSEALWFSFRDIKTVTKGCSFCTSSGLLSANGRPKKSWTKFLRSIKQLEENSGEYTP